MKPGAASQRLRPPPPARAVSQQGSVLFCFVLFGGVLKKIFKNFPFSLDVKAYQLNSTSAALPWLSPRSRYQNL